MNTENLITMAFLAIAFIAIVFLLIMFIKRTSSNLPEKNEKSFKNLINIQLNYEKLRKDSRCPCSLIYANAVIDDSELIGGEQSEKEVERYINSVMLDSFCDADNMICNRDNKSFVIVTKLSEQGIIDRINQTIQVIKLNTANEKITKAIKLYFGAYLIPAGNVDFDESLKRSKLAGKKAKTDNVPYIAWDYNLQQDYDTVSKLDKVFFENLEGNNFFLEFQPIVDIKTGDVKSGEVLARLSDDDSNVVSPRTFIPVIKNIGYRKRFDFLIFEKVCKWLNYNSEVLETLDHLSVNFSRDSIASENFVQKLTNMMDINNIKYENIAVEILEDMPEEKIDMGLFTGNLKKLRELGISILIDDFGSGYTSFDDLKTCHTNIIKIDKSIIKNTTTELGLRVFKSILKVADEIDASIVCEGVETSEQLEIIKANGCKYVQGYYFYYPMNSVQFKKLIANNK